MRRERSRPTCSITGCPTVGQEEQPDAADCDFVVGRLAELDDVVRLGLPLAPGKLPNDLLAGFLGGLAADDPALVVPPAVGEDVAALDLAGAELLVAHGDPITLGGADVGAAAVLVNVNDIAAAGAEPRWLLATVLLPAGTTPSEAQTLLGGLAEAAARAGVTLAGGHTEVTAVVTRPVVSLTALGTVGRAELKDKRSARTGDRVLLTKALAMEGTALLAEELGERLLALGMSADELAACRALQERTSVLARGARRARRRPACTPCTTSRRAAWRPPARAGRGHRPRRARAPRPRPGRARDGARLRAPGRRPAGAHRLRQPADLLRPRRRGRARRRAARRQASPRPTSAS